MSISTRQSDVLVDVLVAESLSGKQTPVQPYKPLQDVCVFKSETFGNVLLLDGAWTTEGACLVVHNPCFV